MFLSDECTMEGGATPGHEGTGAAFQAACLCCRLMYESGEEVKRHRKWRLGSYSVFHGITRPLRQ